MSSLPKYLIPILEKIAKNEGFVDFITDVNTGSNIGDNFTSQLLRVVIAGCRQQADGSKIEEQLHLLCKLAPENEKRREEFQVDSGFDSESYFYTRIVPQFMQFQLDRGLPEDDHFRSFPKCYEVFSDPENGHYAIIIEDLRPKKFAMWPKEKPVPENYLATTLRELAKYHAISFAMKDQQPEQFAEHKKLTNPAESSFSESMLTSFWESHQRTIDVLQDDEQKTIMRDVQKNCEKYFQVGEDDVEANRVVIHGDLWNNNILYRTNETTENVEEVCLVDFQEIRYVSPAIDLLFLLFTSTDRNTRKHHFENLLHIYYNQLTNNIRKLGSDPEKLFPYEALVDELKACGNFAFVIAPIVIQLCVVDPTDVSDLDEICEQPTENGKSFDVIQRLSERSQLLFNERVCHCIEDLVKFGYYRKPADWK